MAKEEKNTNEQAKEQQDQNRPEQGAQSAVAESGSTGLIANVDTAYSTGETDEDGNEVTGYALGGSYFQTSEEDAKELVATNKAYFAKQNDNGNYVVDNEKTEEFKNSEAIEYDNQVAEASAENAKTQRARFMNSAAGMLGRDAAESNAMPGDADELTGRYVDAGNANREQELHENSGVSFDAAGNKVG